MNPEETLRICRLAKAASPAQAIDEYSPELWALVLKPFRYVDAEQALTELAGDQEWIHVSHIKKRIKRIRGERLIAYGVLPDPPLEIEGDPAAYSKWHHDLVRSIADGTTVAAPASIAAATKRRDEEKHRAELASRMKAARAALVKRVHAGPALDEDGESA